ncbi:hypothetical protein [Azotobacter salinestris]|uniref:hypothetical protein n=1 Tax=Azotobacter salinestris TaxID=69964 RepID=UPI0032DF553B
MDHAARLRRAFQTRPERLPGTGFTGLAPRRRRPLPGDGVDREREARLRGRHADGERDRAPFDTALPLGERPAPQAVSHA